MNDMIGQPQWGQAAQMQSPGMQGLNQIQPAMQNMMQGQAQPDPRILEWLKRHLMSGGGGDLRNLMMALGPAAQAAGGMGQAASIGSRMGMPARAPGGMDAAEQMFNTARPAPQMPPMGQGGMIDPRLAMAGGMAGGGAAMLGPDLLRLVQELKARNALPRQ